mgnify:CR=1 FL=1|jgi:hypothetical protein
MEVIYNAVIDAITGKAPEGVCLDGVVMAAEAGASVENIRAAIAAFVEGHGVPSPEGGIAAVNGAALLFDEYEDGTHYTSLSGRPLPHLANPANAELVSHFGIELKHFGSMRQGQSWKAEYLTFHGASIAYRYGTKY